MSSEHWDLDQDNTMGGNSPSPNKVSSQKAIKEYVDSSTGATVDQTYDGTSVNPQSGIAIEGELSTNYQPKLVSGTNIKTINNTSLLGSGDISVLQNTATGTDSLTIDGTASIYQRSVNIGVASSTGTNDCVACGYYANAGGSYSTALGVKASVMGNSAIQLGYGSNSDANSLWAGFYNNSTTHYNWKLLDGTTGLIPDARISSNIARTSAIPTQASDISAADTTLANVLSIDSNSAVKTALDGKADTNLSNLSATGSKVIDGQWIMSRLALAENVTWTSSYTSPALSLSNYLPNDGYDYEVLLSGEVITGTTSGQFISLYLRTDLMSEGIEVATVRTRSASSLQAAGTVILPVGSGRWVKQYKSTSSNANGTFSLYLLGYRRIGTNS